MADYTMATKRTAVVFLKTRRNQRDALIREQYNIVSFDGDPATYIEGLAVPDLRQVNDGLESPVKSLDVFDEIRIYDAPPLAWARIGTLQ